MAASNLQCSNAALLPWSIGQHTLAEELPACPTYTPDATVQQNINAFSRAIQAKLDRKERERLGLSPELPGISGLFDDSDSLDPVVQIVLDNQYEDFGFAVYRMDYDDEAKWLCWYEHFDKLLDASLEQSAGGEKIMDRLIMYKVEDEELNHLPFRAASDYHVLMQEDKTFPPGCDNGVALAVDSAVMDALLNPTPGVPPWVYVFGESHDFFMQDESDLAPDEFLGYMPVAIESLLPYLWPDLQSGLSLMELWATWTMDEEHPVWTDALGF